MDDRTAERATRSRLDPFDRPTGNEQSTALGGAAIVTVDRSLVVVVDDGGLQRSRFNPPTRVGQSLADAFGIEDFDELEAACRVALVGEEVVLICNSRALGQRYLVRLAPRTDGHQGAVSLWVDMGDVGERSEAERARGDELQQLWLACRTLARVEGRAATREAICEAARKVSGCSSVALIEPADSRRELEATASHGFSEDPAPLPLDELSGATLALRTGGQQATMEDDSQPPGARDLMERCSAKSMLWQPVSRGRVIDAVICVGYGSGDPAPAARERRVIEALAVEASMALERDRRWRKSVEEVSADSPLGLSSRTSFEHSLERELHRVKRREELVSLAVLRIDPAGVGLGGGAAVGGEELKALIASWMPQIRVSDLLAHYGVDRFALLFCNCDLEGGSQTLERMLGAGETTFHAGLVASDGSDSLERLAQRVSEALDRARQAGPGSISF